MNRNGPIVAVMALGMIFGIASATNAQDSAAEGGSTPEVMSECPMHDQGGKSKGCDMMQDGGMMSGGKSMMRHHGGHHRRHHGGAPMIVINIYPDGGMLTMDHGGRGMMDQPSRQGLPRGAGAMGHGPGCQARGALNGGHGPWSIVKSS